MDSRRRDYRRNTCSPHEPEALIQRIAARHSPASTIKSACLLGTLLVAGTAQAATITVNAAADVDPPVGSDGCTLREAITNANDNTATFADCSAGAAGLDVIAFGAALIGQTITLSGTQLPTISETLTITGPIAGEPGGITLDGNNSSRILEATDAPAARVDLDLVLNSLTLTNGRTTADNENGGALNGTYANVQLIDCVVTGNATEGANSAGGGMSINGDVSLQNSTVSNNSTQGDGASGGGLFVLGEASLTRSKVSNNTTLGKDAFGGGMSVAEAATLLNSTVSGNSTIGENAIGGGLFVFAGSTTVTSSTVSGNSTAGAGADGGGLISGGSIVLTNSTVSGNSATGAGAFGGGMVGGGGGTTLNHVSFVANSATTGGSSVHLGSPANNLAVNNSIFAPASGVACNTPIDSGSNNLVIDASCGTATLVASAPTSKAAIDLQALAYNGGFTEAHALGITSVARDTGNSGATCTGMPVNGLDQRGITRPQGTGCDVGATEFVPTGVLAFQQPEFVENEDLGPATITVMRSDGTSGMTQLQINVTDDTATAPADYSNPMSPILSWADGEGGPKSFSIALNDDGLDEPVEHVDLAMFATIGAVRGDANSARLAIQPPGSSKGTSGGGGGCNATSHGHNDLGWLALLLGGGLWWRRRRA